MMTPLEKFSGPSAKNGYFKIVKRGDPLGRQVVESLRGGVRPSPKSAPDHECFFRKEK